MHLEEVIQRANAGDVDAMVAIANYYTDQAEKQNQSSYHADALVWYEKAAELGNEYSMKMAFHTHLLFAHAGRKALEAEFCEDTFQEHIQAAIRMKNMMRDPDPSFQQRIAEEQCCFYSELSAYKDSDVEKENLRIKAFNLMKPYADRYVSGEAFIYMLTDLCCLGYEYIIEANLVPFLVKNVSRCEAQLSSHDLYSCMIGFIHHTLGTVFLAGENDDTAYSYFLKASKYDEDAKALLSRFKKKLFGGYKYVG